MANQEKNDVIAGEHIEMRIDSEELWRAGDDRARFFQNFARERVFDFFAMLDTAAGKMPARAIAVANEKHARCFVDNEPLRAESHDLSATGMKRKEAFQNYSSLQP